MKVPDPEKYGGQADAVKKFKTGLMIQIEASPQHFSTKRAKIMYMAGLLIDTAEVWFRPKIETMLETGVWPTFKDVLDKLEAAFGSPNKKAVAIHNL